MQVTICFLLKLREKMWKIRKEIIIRLSVVLHSSETQATSSLFYIDVTCKMPKSENRDFLPHPWLLFWTTPLFGWVKPRYKWFWWHYSYFVIYTNCWTTEIDLSQSHSVSKSYKKGTSLPIFCFSRLSKGLIFCFFRISKALTFWPFFQSQFWAIFG